jgi:hypothetical protein
VEFEIQEKVFADYEVNDPFANELILSLQKSVSSYENVLIENFYESILQMLSEYVCSRIEKSIFQKKFTFVRLNFIERSILILPLFSGGPCSLIKMFERL